MSAKTQQIDEKKPKKHTLDSDEEESDEECDRNNRLEDDDFDGEEVRWIHSLFNIFLNGFYF